MSDYSNAKIYKLVSDKTTMIYIGSTKRSLKERIREHKKTFKHNIGLNTSKKLFELGGNISIELIKLFPCDCRKQLQKEEGKYIIEYKNKCVNSYIPLRTKKEYYEDKKDEILKKKKIYRNNNKEKILKKSKIYYEKNIEKIKEKNKKYVEKNKEKIKERKKKYYENNKQKYLCECGSEILKCTKARHEISIKHISFINNNK